MIISENNIYSIEILRALIGFISVWRHEVVTNLQENCSLYLSCLVFGFLNNQSFILEIHCYNPVLFMAFPPSPTWASLFP